MLTTKSLVAISVLGVVVAVLFAFTLIGLAGEAVAVLAIATLLVKGIMRGRKRRVAS